MQAPLQERADWYHRGWEANAQATLNQLCTTARTTQAIQHATTTESRALLLLTNAGHWSDHHSELTPTHPIRKLNVRFFHRDRYSLFPPQQRVPVLREECCAGRANAAFYIYSWFQCENQHRTCAVQMGLHYREGNRESSQDTHCTPLLHKTHVLHGETIIPS